MKKIPVIVVVLISSFAVKAQTPDTITKAKTDTNRIWTNIETDPQYPGGIDKLFKYIRHNSKYEGDDEGKVLVSFIIDENGT